MKLRLIVLPVLTAAALAVPTAASAGTLTHSDPAGDVVAIDLTSAGGSMTPAPTRANGDIVATRLTYVGSTVRVKVRFRDLARKGTLITELAIKSGRSFRYVELTARPGAYAGRLKVTTHADAPVKCAGTTHTIDYTANTELLTIPARCLGGPSWVRIGVGEITTEDGFRHAWGDDARTNGDVTGNDLILSPRIYR